MFLMKLPSDSAAQTVYKRAKNEGWGGGISEVPKMYSTIMDNPDAVLFDFFITMFGRTHVKYVAIDESYEQEGGIALQKNSEFRDSDVRLNWGPNAVGKSLKLKICQQKLKIWPHCSGSSSTTT